MAFESQMTVQRGFGRARGTGDAFTLRVYDSKQAGKESVKLNVKIPTALLKEAGIAPDAKIDIFYDHENRKCMVAPALTGVAFSKKDNYIFRDFVFAKGFTPDFGGGFIVEKYEFTNHGDEKGIVFDYPPLALVTGRNLVKPGESMTRAQSFAAKLVEEEQQRLVEAQELVKKLGKDGTTTAAPTPAAPAAAPTTAKPGPITVTAPKRGERGEEAEHARKELLKRIFALMEDEKKPLNFEAACKKAGVTAGTAYRWKNQLGAKVKKEMARERKNGVIAAQNAAASSKGRGHSARVH